MQKGICALSAVPLRAEPSDTSEMINQVLFGETYQLVEERKKWVKIRLDHDKYQGWLDRKQHCVLAVKMAEKLIKKPPAIASDLIEMVSQKDGGAYFPVFIGSHLPLYSPKNHSLAIADEVFTYTGPVAKKKSSRKDLVEVAFQYLNAPYLWGGRSPFGIDCSGLTQMVYRLCGHHIPRDSIDQAQLGHALSFIEESEPGDLAFFDNQEGRIVHVGLILENNYIIHASGKVRLDRLDQTGIFNPQERKHTHKLRVIKKII